MKQVVKSKWVMAGIVTVSILVATAFIFPVETYSTFSSNNDGGAVVVNPGNGQPNGHCWYGSFDGDRMTANLTPSGNGMLSCQFDDITPFKPAYKTTGFGCVLYIGGEQLYTTDTVFIGTPAGKGQMTCQFN